MRGLLLLSDPDCGRLEALRWLDEGARLHWNIQWYEATLNRQSLLSMLQSLLQHLRETCDWICIMAEGNLTAHALALAAQFSVERLILLGDSLFCERPAERNQRKINAFARRNLALITSEIIAVDMGDAALRRLKSGLGLCSGGLIHVADAAELWRKRESFLTAPFRTLAE